MGLLGKKKKETPKEEEKTPIIETETTDKTKLTPEQEQRLKYLKQRFQELQDFTTYTPQQFDSLFKAELCNIMFANYVALQEILDEMRKEE